MIYVESDDAGALFRFVDVYQRVEKGQARIAVDAPMPNQGGRDGNIDARDFNIVGEPAYKPFAAAPKTKPGAAEILKVSRLRFGFKLSSDQIVVHDGTVVGPLMGATIEGKIDFAKNDVKVRGAVIPLFMDQGPLLITPLPPAEGVISASYEISGPIAAPVVRIDPAGPFAPGLLRKLFSFDSNEK
jgi:hypothetical protein